MTQLMAIARSRTEPASRVERARMLLAYRAHPSFFAVGRLLGTHHHTVQRCVERDEEGMRLDRWFGRRIPTQVPETNADGVILDS